MLGAVDHTEVNALGNHIAATRRPMIVSDGGVAVGCMPHNTWLAVKAAVALGLNPRTFVVAVTYAASFSFITPLEPACVLVYTPGRYRFMDFVKIGTILTIIVFTVSIILVPIFWPL